MGFKFIDDIRNLIDQAKTWFALELDYAKLTVAEKLTTLLTYLIIGFLSALMGFVIVIFLCFGAAYAFSHILPLWASFLIVAGIVLLILLLIMLFRKPLLLNPLAKLFTRIIISPKEEERKEINQ